MSGFTCIKSCLSYLYKVKRVKNIQVQFDVVESYVWTKYFHKCKYYDEH